MNDPNPAFSHNSPHNQVCEPKRYSQALREGSLRDLLAGLNSRKKLVRVLVVGGQNEGEALRASQLQGTYGQAGT